MRKLHWPRLFSCFFDPDVDSVEVLPATEGNKQAIE